MKVFLSLTLLPVFIVASFPCRLQSVPVRSLEEKILLDYLWHEVINIPAERRPKIGLVLSGGGARGFSHIGVLRVFEEHKIPIDIIVGTSVGAIIGSLYVNGVPLEKIEYMSVDMGWDKLTDVSSRSIIDLLISEKLLSTDRMESYLNSYLADKNFHELKKKFACVATDLVSGEKIIFTEGNVARAVRASATLPGVFEPVNFRHRLLVDGGLVDNIPVDVAKNLGADIVIVLTARSDFSRNNVSNVFGVLIQSIYIQGTLLESESLKKADVVIMPDVKDVRAIDFSKAQECINAGILEANKKIDGLKRYIIDRTFEKNAKR